MGAALDLLQACYLLTRSLLAQIWRNVRALDLEAQPVRADCPGPSVNPHTAYGNYGSAVTARARRRLLPALVHWAGSWGIAHETARGLVERKVMKARERGMCRRQRKRDCSYSSVPSRQQRRAAVAAVLHVVVVVVRRQLLLLC